MKKIYSLLLLGGLLLFGAENVWATDIRSGGNLYVRNLNNAGITGLWKLSTAYMRVYVFGTSGSVWLNPTNDSPVVGTDGDEGAVYKFVIPTGTWSTIIITRGATDSYEFDGNKWNQTGDIPLPSDGNLIYSYKSGDATNGWLNYDESTTATNWYLYSNSGEWSTVQFIKATSEATTASATVAVSTVGSSLEFYLQSAASGKTLKNKGTMNPTSGAWTFNTTDNNAHFMSTVAGNYTFTLNLENDEVSIAYPTSYTRPDISAAGIWGTICLPVDGTISNASLYSIIGTYDNKLYLSAEGSSSMTAGKPYIFKSSAATPSVLLANTVYEATPLSESDATPHPTNGLYGRYENQSFEGWNTSTVYIVRNASIQMAKTGSGDGNYSGIYANRAFIQMVKVPALGSAPSAPSAIRFDLEEENATSINAIGAFEKAVKFIENGKLYILRDGVKYDATGRVVR